MPVMLEITAVYRGERFRFSNADGDVIIGDAHANSDINGLVVIKGQADEDELIVDQTYRFYGNWTDYKNKRTGQTERQFAFQSFVPQAPASREGIIAYLKQHGEGNGLGHARASKLYDLFGSDAVRVAREEPDRIIESLAAAKLKLSPECASLVAASLVRAQAIEGATLDLIDLVKGRGFPKATARQCLKEWGNLAGRLIRRCPYKLMKFKGCGFKKCDALYLDLKLPPTRLIRQALSAWYSVAKNTEGHTWFPANLPVRYVKDNIHGVKVDPQRAMQLAIRGKILAEQFTTAPHGPIAEDGRIRWVAERTKADHEIELAENIAAAMREPATIWPAVELLQAASDHQRGELARSLSGTLGILGGGPGTGKTFTLAALVKAIIPVVGLDNIAIGAPTGKAAVRVTENLSRYGVPLRARTWHSQLARMIAEGGERSKFRQKVLIGDETSMNDTDLMASIFRARAAGTHVLLVGDVNQLPPVGHGAPLRDMIFTGLPYGELTEIKRNSGGIVEACAAIRENRPWSAGDNLHLLDTSDAADQIRTMIGAIRSAANKGLDPVWDVQVVCAVNKRSPVCRQELNKVLQAELNDNPGVSGSPFRVGDKIVNTKNSYFPTVDYATSDEEISTNERGEVYVANGELGAVIYVEEKLIIAKLDSPSRTIRIPRGKQAVAESGDSNEDAAGNGDGGDDNAPTTGCTWDLGYALSVHKSQGSEWPVVIVMIDEGPGAKLVCDRAWLYTAISRAKDKCVLIGKKTTADRFCKLNKMTHRKTLLKERILLECAVSQLGDL